MDERSKFYSAPSAAADKREHECRCADALTVDEVMAAHAQFGRLNKASIKEAMGRNWPTHWDDIPEGEGIFGSSAAMSASR